MRQGDSVGPTRRVSTSSATAVRLPPARRGWGWSNAGLVVGDGASLLVDTLFDLRLTREMLDAMAPVTAAAPIATVVNTHANGDHCYGNELVGGAEIVASTACADEMGAGAAGDARRAARSADRATSASCSGRFFGDFEFDGHRRSTPPTRTFDGRLDARGRRSGRRADRGRPGAHRRRRLVHVPDANASCSPATSCSSAARRSCGPAPSELGGGVRPDAGLDVDTVVPGHGPVTDKAGVAEVRDYLLWVEREAKVRFDAGLSALDAAREMMGEYRHWGEGERLVVNIAAIYRELDPDRPPSFVDLFAQMAELSVENV